MNKFFALKWIICLFKPCDKRVESVFFGKQYWTCTRCGNDNYGDRA